MTWSAIGLLNRSITLSLQNIIDDSKADDEGQAEKLGLAQGAKHQAVGSETFHKESFHRVEDAVEADDLTMEFVVMVVHPQEEPEQQKTPDGFIQEGRMVGYAVNDLSPWKICRAAVGFFIEKVSPPANGLG